MSDEFRQFVSGANVPLYYLSQTNVPYIEYQSLNVAINLYIAKLVEMNSFTEQQMRGNLSIQTIYGGANQANYVPTYYEQSLYFID